MLKSIEGSFLLVENYKNQLKLMGLRLKIARIFASYKSATVFAIKNGFKVTTYQRHESGKKEASLFTLMSYCKILNISFIWLLTGAKEYREIPFEYLDIKKNGI